MPDESTPVGQPAPRLDVLKVAWWLFGFWVLRTFGVRLGVMLYAELGMGIDTDGRPCGTSGTAIGRGVGTSRPAFFRNRSMTGDTVDGSVAVRGSRGDGSVVSVGTAEDWAAHRAGAAQMRIEATINVSVPVDRGMI